MNQTYLDRLTAFDECEPLDTETILHRPSKPSGELTTNRSPCKSKKQSKRSFAQILGQNEEEMIWKYHKR